MTKPKGYNESFARFFEEPTREGFREIMKVNHGELRSCDFKGEWPEKSGLSKHILGIANTGGGCIIIGVTEAEDGTFVPGGLDKIKDKADVTNAIKSYLPNQLLNLIDIVDFSYDASEYPKIVGKRFQVLFVPDDPTHLPFIAMKDGDGIRQNAIYIRLEGLTKEASNDELQSVINRRLDTGYSTQKEMDLKTHLEQLKTLYSFLAEKHLGIGSLMTMMAITGISYPNPKYPQEDFESFIHRMIEKKKQLIEKELDL